MIDWRIAEQVAGAVAGRPPAELPPTALAEWAQESERLVTEYTQMTPAHPLPGPEAIDRGAWVRANLRSARTMLNPSLEKFGDGLGPLRGPVRSAAGVVVATELGAVVGYLGQRVLGQYDLVLLDPDAPARLLFVAPNLAQAAKQFEAEPDDVWRWVALHEVTHAVQFTSVPWLREHMATQLRALLSDFEVSFDAAAISKIPNQDDIRRLVEMVREGGLIALVASEEERERIDAVQALMAVIEGHAEHVMDATGAELLPSLPQLRAALERRRKSQSGLQRILNRLLGLDLKLRQYELGKRFCDAVVERGGIEKLNQVWQAPEFVPNLQELSDPDAWLMRVNGQAAGST